MADLPLKLGKKPARPDAVTFKMSKYVDIDAWAKRLNIPRAFGHEDMIGKDDWGMLGNDQAGCCVFSSMAHRHQLWCAIGGVQTKFKTADVLASYRELTGFDPNDPSTDNGTDMGEAAKYNRRTGIRDSTGNVHKVEAYLKIDKGDLLQHYIAMRLFGLVDIGFNFPGYAWRQFELGQPWRVLKGGEMDGGHCVPVVARKGWLYCVTWGRLQPMSIPFLERFNDESVVYLEEEFLKDGRSPEGFDVKQLREDLAKLH